MNKILVVGTSASGKSTISKEISKVLDIPRLELDMLHWKPNWTEVPDDEMWEGIEKFTSSSDQWVIDGNYSVHRDKLWPKADTIVWLNYPFRIVMWRGIKRVFRRSLRGEVVCNGNKESLWRAFFHKDSILLWIITSYKRRKKEYKEIIPQHSNLQAIIFDHPRSANKWLNKLKN